LSNYEEEELVGVPNHPNWITFLRNPTQVHDSPRVIIYINIYISFLCFSLCNDLFNHRDISYVSFFNCSLIYYLINVYSDLFQLALKYFKNTEVDLNNVLIMTGDFNIRDNFWDSNFLYHSSYRNTLFDIADSFHLEISKPIEFFPTRYSNNVQDSNLVLDLVFLQPNSTKYDNHHIYSDWRLISDHAPITVDILVVKEHILTTK